MKKALVLGASGGMGYAIVKELSQRGIAVKAFARTENKLKKLFAQDTNVTIAAGDIFQLDDLTAAAQDVDIIFQAANIPYTEWEENLLQMMNNVIIAAKAHSAKLAVVDNIYAYGNAGTNVTETQPKNPCTKKGRIRLEVETTIKQSGVPFIIAHFPDFYGPNAYNTILHVTLQNVLQNKRAIFVGKQTIPREFIFTPDGAKALVQLALEENAYGENWNIPGAGVITGEEIVSILRELTHYQKKVSTVSKSMIQMLGLFNREMREVAEMFYLNETPVVLSGEKYEERIGPIPQTSYREGLRQTLEYLG
ncbi:SDR family NAD(P)-dependent oxidoreductase [Bacillus benzoevorans]|uniref:Nucleoside-diphosphate-sugar epimerase n=1 Tax=Bacillus benzoevorans TaxID=1456 RepID=A0A7X0HR36_9BACI|nr:SDR family NAD(P)-dependent oxidoreductase [Bacillus benzoevorans]MBB6445395.1 nucleoside-diphosphate-sugar epimerase [Bacillus benzoevorans]